MKLSGPACTEAMNEAEEAGRRERAEDRAGGVRVERRVRPRLAPEDASLVTVDLCDEFVKLRGGWHWLEGMPAMIAIATVE